jgi:cytoskeletal protein RodZ
MFRLLQSQLDPQHKQRTKLLEIGVYLQKNRLEQSLSLEEIAQKTLIPRHRLEALEAGDLEALPEPIYIRWLIKQFADSLSLDGETISRRFPTKVNNFFRGTKPSLSLPSLQIRPIHLYFLYLILVIGSVQTLSHVLQKSVLQSNRLPPPSLPQQQIVQRKSNPLQPVANKTSNNQQLVVGVKLEDDCWLRVVVDGKTEFEGVLPQGTHRTWQANRELTVRAGNAGGVYVAVNNANAKQLGQPGKVEEVTYRAN